MIKIVQVEINRYRSIMNMTVKLDKDYNIITICGKNNVGKTNTLRAINLFFNPDEYEPQIDMPKFKVATGGATIHPKIVITLWDEIENVFYEIERNWVNWKDSNGIILKGIRYTEARNSTTELDEKECEKVLGKIKFYYLEAANMIIPQIINEIADEMLTDQFKSSRFINTKKELKKAYDTYVDGLQEILDNFASSISETFKLFKSNWNVKFLVPKNSDSFRELISDDVVLTIDDKGTLGIDDKGSGLQRLATILLQVEAGLRSKKEETAIFCIDEPDIFLHEGLQNKLKHFFYNKADNAQFMYTTHSKVFIDTLYMKNVILLDAILHEQYSTRKKKNINVIETKIVDIEQDAGYEQICENLGIEKVEYNVLEKNNIIVEGNCDKKYIENLMRYFGISIPKVISANGATNIIKYLEFYESYYFDINQYIPNIVVVYDNDATGREHYEKNSKKKFPHLNVKHYLISNYCGDESIDVLKTTTNNEIEDFIYPEVMCYLVNEILKKKNMNQIDSSELLQQLESKAFRKSGFLLLCEHYKNTANLENGDKISFTSSGKATNQIKESLAGVFELEGNRKLLKIIEDAENKYPSVKATLLRLSKMLEDN